MSSLQYAKEDTLTQIGLLLRQGEKGFGGCAKRSRLAHRYLLHAIIVIYSGHL